MTVNLARYRPTGEHVAIRRIDLESCTNEMVNYLQVWTCHHPSIILQSICHISLCQADRHQSNHLYIPLSLLPTECIHPLL